MQTQVLPKIGNDAIYLEFLDQGTGLSTKTMIDEFPFIIGRNATCHLTVESGRVSREHAEIVRHGSGYLLRDLRSTNGTSVNGEEIEEHILTDGDTVSIADFEFDFHCPSDATARQTVTLAMEDRERSGGTTDPRLLIQALRTANQWAGLSRIDPMLCRVVSLAHHQPVGYWCPTFQKAYQDQWDTRFLSSAGRLESSLRLLQHASAMHYLVEQAQPPGFVLLEIDQADFNRPDLLEVVGWMRSHLGPETQVILGGTPPLWEANLGANPLIESLAAMGVQLAAVGVEQFKSLAGSEIVSHMALVGVSASALAAASRSPAVATSLQQFIQQVAVTGTQVVAQAGPSRTGDDLIQRLGFQAIVLGRS